ncbi:peptidoglycan-binding domain-containing protein [Lentilitoribacter sp. EG35]|uniref:peptidoglycan-binding domain-containing protein n=1 Tax=Lentilitoribacter sp. EG35 TaxID=3234192 RepID=UPI00345FC7ED
MQQLKPIFLIPIFISFLLVLVTVNNSQSDEFPLTDGRYVTNQNYCSYDEGQIFDEFGDGAALNVRTIKDGTIDFHYESTCRIADVKVLGSDVLYTSVCSSEGEEFSEREHMTLNSSTSFTQDRITFGLCEGSVSQSSVSNEPEITEPEMIFALQRSLTALGFDPGPTDGLIGKKTISALNLFLTSKGLSRTDYVTQSTFDVVAIAHIEFTTGVKWEDFEDYKPNDESQSLAEVEPAAGEKLSNGSDLHSFTTEELKTHLLNQEQELNFAADKFKQLLIEDSSLFGDKFGGEVYPTLKPVLLSRTARDRLLSGSIVLFGCVGDPTEVFGFYNLPLNIWTILWVEDREKIVQSEMSLGIALNDEPELNSWFERMLRENISAKQAIDDSIASQALGFSLMFNPKTCANSKDIEQGYFAPDKAVAMFYKNESNIRLLDLQISQKIDQLTQDKFVGEKEHSVSLSRLEEDISNGQHYIITLHSVKEDPTVSIIQKWKLHDEAITLLEADLSISLGRETQ